MSFINTKIMLTSWRKIQVVFCSRNKLMMVPACLNIWLNLGDITVFGFHQNPRNPCHWLLLVQTNTRIPRGKGPRQGKPAGDPSQMPEPPDTDCIRILLVSIASLLRSLTDSSCRWGLSLDDELDVVLQNFWKSQGGRASLQCS